MELVNDAACSVQAAATSTYNNMTESLQVTYVQYNSTLVHRNFLITIIVAISLIIKRYISRRKLRTVIWPKPNTECKVFET